MLELVAFMFGIALAVVALFLQLFYLLMLLSDRKSRRLIRSFFKDPLYWNRAEAVRYVKKFFNSSE